MLNKNWWKQNCLYLVLIGMSIIAFLLFRDAIKNNNEALMVLITAIYVIATMKISNANIKSAEATRKQLEKTVEQYEDSRHLQIMPFIQASFSHVRHCAYSIDLHCSNNDRNVQSGRTQIKLENIGKGAANNITYTWHYKNFQEKGEFGMVGIIEGNFYDIDVSFNGDLQKEKSSGTLVLIYEDLLGKSYSQNIYIHFINDNDDEENLKIWTEIPKTK